MGTAVQREKGSESPLTGLLSPCHGGVGVTNAQVRHPPKQEGLLETEAQRGWGNGSCGWCYGQSVCPQCLW